MKEKKEKSQKNKSDKKPNQLIEIIKKKWLINGTMTCLLVAIIIAVFIAINIIMQKLELAPIDFTQEKLYTLTEASKEKVKGIDKDVKIYFVGYEESDANLDLAKQYKKANEKITAESVDTNSRPDLANKYGIESGIQGIIVECGEKYKILSEEDLVTYDTSTYETISIAEEKLTSSIVSVTSQKIPKVYFLEGYSTFSLAQNMNYLGMYLENEINEIATLNLLTTNNTIPEDCDTLVITTPNQDFNEIATKAIIDYIQSGKNILWLNSAITAKKDMPNVNKILETYGVKPFEEGIIRETDASKMVTGSPDLILPEIEYSKITEDLYNTTGVVFVNATKINIDEDKLEELNVTKNDLLFASESSYYRTNFNNQADTKSGDEEAGTFLVGAELQKTIKEANEETGESAVTSKLVIYGENYFVSDYPLNQTTQYPTIQIASYNKDLVLNAIAYLVDREEDITARKDTGVVTYTATEAQDTIIRVIIFAVPIVIIIAGIVIWQIRRRKK